MAKDKDIYEAKKGTNAAAALIIGVGDIIQQRSGTHGDAFENLSDIARRWTHYLNSLLSKQDKGELLKLTAADVAYCMTEMKLSRATYGDNAELDHPMDIVGYAGIWAAYLLSQKDSKLSA